MAEIDLNRYLQRIGVSGMRPVGWWGLLSVVPLLAGCLGGAGGSDGADPGTTPSATYAITAGIPTPEPPKLTDVLHFLDGNTLTTVAPDSYQPIRIPMYAPVGQPGSTRLTVWNFTWPADVALIRGVLHLTVEVQGSVAGSPYSAARADGTACFWFTYIEVYDPTASAVERDERGNSAPCAEEPAVVPEGVRVLDLPFELPGTRFAAGDIAVVQFGVESYGKAPDARIDLLTGSITQDSTITFEGVGWPEGLEKVTLLTATT